MSHFTSSGHKFTGFNGSRSSIGHEDQWFNRSTDLYGASLSRYMSLFIMLFILYTRSTVASIYSNIIVAKLHTTSFSILKGMRRLTAVGCVPEDNWK